MVPEAYPCWGPYQDNPPTHSSFVDWAVQPGEELLTDRCRGLCQAWAARPESYQVAMAYRWDGMNPFDARGTLKNRLLIPTIVRMTWTADTCTRAISHGASVIHYVQYISVRPEPLGLNHIRLLWLIGVMEWILLMLEGLLRIGCWYRP